MPEESIEVKLTRIETMANRGLKPAAAQLSRLILEKNPKNVEALLWLARTTNRPDEAEQALNKAATLRPDDRAVQEMVAGRQAGRQQSQPFAGVSTPPPQVPNPYSAGPYQYQPPTPPAPGYAPPPTPPGSYAPPPNSQYWETQPPQPAAPYGPNAAPPTSYDFLRNLGSTATGAVPVASVAPKPVKKRSNPLGLVTGVLFVLGGLALAIIWSISLLNYQSDLGQAANPLPAQITDLSPSKLVADVKGQNKRTFEINESMFKTLAPLISDGKSANTLAPNQVVLNVTPGGRIASIQVNSPNKGTVANAGSSLLGFGPAVDWSPTAGGIILLLVGLLVLGNSLGKTRVA